MCQSDEAVAKVSQDIEALLKSFVTDTRLFGKYAVEAAILYTPDVFSDLLEPSFATRGVAYKKWRPVSKRHGLPNSGLVSYVYSTGEPSVSRDAADSEPGDPRIGIEARQIRSEYGFRNSLAAFGLRYAYTGPFSRLKERVGDHDTNAVLLLHLQNQIPEDDDPSQEVLADVIADERRELERLLQLHDSLAFERIVGFYERLTLTFLNNIRPIGTTKRMCDDLVRIWSECLQVSEFLIQIEPPTPGAKSQLFCSFGDEMNTAAFCQVLQDVFEGTVPFPSVMAELGSVQGQTLSDVARGFVCNFKEQHPEIWTAIGNPLRLSKHNWAGTRIPYDGVNVSIFVGRPSNSPDDQWTLPEITFLERSTRLFQYLLNRSTEFGGLLDKLADVYRDTSQESYEAAQYEFFYHLFKDFLDTDQMLVSRVRRTAEGYSIAGEFARGFGPKGNQRLADGTNRELRLTHELDAFYDGLERWDDSAVDSTYRLEMIESRLDVLALILRQHFEHRGKHDEQVNPRFYCVNHSKQYRWFTLDPDLAKECRITGTVCFVPCCTSEDDGTEVLRSIVMLANSKGETVFDAEGHLGGRDDSSSLSNLLEGLGTAVAESLATGDRREVERELASLREETLLDARRLERAANSGTKLCHSLGCTVWLRADLLSLVGGPVISTNDLGDVFKKLFSSRADGVWDRLDRDLTRVALEMVAAFLGVDVEAAGALLDSPEMKEITPLIGRSTYVMVAMSTSEATVGGMTALERASSSLSSLMDAFGHERDDAKFGTMVCEFLAEQTYLPGYGLTGWVLRHRVDMRLASATEEDIKAFWRDVKRSCARGGNVELAISKACKRRGFSTVLWEDAAAIPKHVGHLGEQPTSPKELETFLCCPLEQIDDSETVAGVVRVSTSGSARSEFSAEDLQSLSALRVHLSRLLRSQYVAANTFSQKMGIDQEFRNLIKHKNAHVPEELEKIEREALQQELDISEPLSYLYEFSDRLNWYMNCRAMLITLSSRPDSLSPEILFDFVRSWFKERRLRADVTTLRNGAVPECLDLVRQTHLDVFSFCKIVDELVTNACRHRPEASQHIVVVIGATSTAVCVVIECDAAAVSRYRAADWVATPDVIEAIRTRVLEENWEPISCLSTPSATGDREGSGIPEILQASSTLGVDACVARAGRHWMYLVRSQDSGVE